MDDTPPWKPILTMSRFRKRPLPKTRCFYCGHFPLLQGRCPKISRISPLTALSEIYSVWQRLPVSLSSIFANLHLPLTLPATAISFECAIFHLPTHCAKSILKGSCIKRREIFGQAVRKGRALTMTFYGIHP